MIAAVTVIGNGKLLRHKVLSSGSLMTARAGRSKTVGLHVQPHLQML